MIELVPLRKQNYTKLVEYNKDKDADFLRQWAGLGYHYPLTVEQLAARQALSLQHKKNSDFITYEIILDKTYLIGTVELFHIDKKTLRATMGRFLLFDEYRGKGLGGETLRAVFRIAKNLYGIEELRLNVYEYNVSAQRCYEKAGFEFESLTEDPITPKWSSYCYVAELYAMDIETGERTLPDLTPELLPDDEEQETEEQGAEEQPNQSEQQYHPHQGEGEQTKEPQQQQEPDEGSENPSELPAKQDEPQVEKTQADENEE